MAGLNSKDWRAALALGQTLAELPQDEGFQLLKQNWSSVTNIDARQQLLKAFDFAAHERLLDVLELGLSDSSPAVQKSAASYVADISLQYEGTNYAAAKNWIAARHGRSLEAAFNDGVREATQLLRDWKGTDRQAQLQFMRLNASLFRKFPNAAKKAGLDELLVDFANGSDEQTKNLTLEFATSAGFGEDWFARVHHPDPHANPQPVRDAAGRALDKMAVAEIVAAMQTCVTRIGKARDAGLLLDMGNAFGQINEYCDQLQGKNKNTAPSPKDWKVDADTHQKILKLLAEIENAAEGMRSIASDTKMPDAQRMEMIRRVWNEKFAKNYADFKATVSSNQK